MVFYIVGISYTGDLYLQHCSHLVPFSNVAYKKIQVKTDGTSKMFCEGLQNVFTSIATFLQASAGFFVCAFLLVSPGPKC